MIRCRNSLLTCCRSFPEIDPMLSYISSYLASQPHPLTPSAEQEPAHDSGYKNSGSGGSVALRQEEQLWEVQWAELEVQRSIGRGSFGWVYLAQWNQTEVVRQGAQGGHECLEKEKEC